MEHRYGLIYKIYAIQIRAITDNRFHYFDAVHF
jgi:hypothetical protein